MEEHIDKSAKNNNLEVPVPRPDGALKGMALNSTKAGMEGVGVDKINQITEEAYKDTEYYINQQDQQAKFNVLIQQICEASKKLSEEQILQSTMKMDEMAKEIELERVLDRVIIYVGVDTYYAAVEMRDNPTLSNVPMAVGTESLLSTSNYLAKSLGVRSGMPGFFAKKICPQLVIVPLNYELYGKVSKEIREIVKLYDPDFSSVRLNEAYLDITDYLENVNRLKSGEDLLTPEEVAQEIRDKIFNRTELSANAGIACNSMLTKICGDLSKPNGQYFLPPTIEDIKEFIVKLPIGKINGIGKSMEQLLHSLNIFTCGDLFVHRGIINLVFKPTTAAFFLARSLGIGSPWCNMCDTAVFQKSISSEIKFLSPKSNIEPTFCRSLCTDLERELISKELKAQIVSVKVKAVDLQVEIRSARLTSATNVAKIIFEMAWNIFMSYTKDIKDLAITLFGVKLSNLQDNKKQVGDNVIDMSKSKKQGRIGHLILKWQTTEITDENIPKLETKISISHGSSSSSTDCKQMSESVACSSPAEERELIRGDFSDLTRNINNNKRKSPESNHSNSKKRFKESVPEKNLKIID